MDSSALVEPSTDQSLAVRTATFNPLLCQECQYLSYPSATASHISGIPSKYSPANLEHLSQKLNCIVCRAVLKAVETQRKGFLVLKDLPASRIFVRNDGPSFLEDCYHFTPDMRCDTRDPKKLVIRVVMNLSITVPPETASESACESGLLVAAPPSSSQGPDSSVPDYTELSLDELQGFRATPQYCLVYSPGDRSELVRIEPWEVPYFDISLLRSWVRDCEISHGDQCTSFVERDTQTPALSHDFRVIDVRSMSVIKPKELVRYVALSYVWQQATVTGQLQLQKSNLENLSSPQGLKHAKLPAAIADSIALCRDIGETFLWVDRLCIVQDDPESKHSQICRMDKIYRSAAFTVIATSKGPGLSGYFGRPRKSSIWGPPRDCKHEGGGVNTHHMQISINPSLWNRRGWTFQERVLSRRRIFITDFQVIFECSKGEAVEEFTWTHQHLPKTRTVTKSEDQTLNLRGWVGHTSEYNSVNYNTATTESMDKYCAWVEDYTSRQLTFDSDILNAFAGVGSYLSGSFSTQFLFGLPEKHIDKAIMWSSSGSVKSRNSTPHIPSWSWAAWKQITRYGEPKFEDRVSLVYFHYQDPIFGLRELVVEERWLGVEMRIDEFRDRDSVPETSVCMPNTAGKYMPGEWRSTRMWQTCPQSPWQALAHKNLDAAACDVAAGLPGSLVFNTTVASLRQHSDKGGIIYAQNGERIGFLQTMAQESQKYYDLIVICGGIAGFSDRKAMVSRRLWGGEPDYDSWRLYVMLVERLPFEPFVARRIGVGYIYAHKWHTCNPRWETVVLC